MQHTYGQLYLEQELARRQSINASYSLRAFASSLDVDAGLLSKILSNKRPLSTKMARKIASRLDLDARTRQQFISSTAGLDFTASETTSAPQPVVEIEEDQFQVISNPIHYAVLELTQAADFKSDSRWMAKRLGINVIEVEFAVNRLERMGLLERQGKKLIKKNRWITTANKSLTSSALKLHQKEILKNCISALENRDINERSNTAMMMTINPQKIALAKKLIEQFMSQLCEVLQDGDISEVYQLAIGLTPFRSTK